MCPLTLPGRVSPVGLRFCFGDILRVFTVFTVCEMCRWGNTTLGAYVFHFYFRDHAAASGNRTRLMWNPLRHCETL